MSYIKGYSFLKRTCVLLSPLFLLTLASKELAFYAPAATLSPILSDPKEEKDSIINLASSLNQELPEGVEDYGSLKIQKTLWGQELWIEETRPLSTFSHNSNYKFQEVNEIIKEETDQDKQKFVLKRDNFTTIQDKGNINVLITFDLTDNYSDPIPVTHIIPLSDLTTTSEKIYEIVTIKLDNNGQAKTHNLKVKKEDSEQKITFELDVPKPIPSSFSLGIDTSSLIIKSFYILFNDSPPLDPKSYFTTNSDGFETIVGDTGSSRVQKIFLDKWNNKGNKIPSPKEPTYEFKTESDFWKSTCSDPYKVGGFIDTDLKQQQQKAQTQENKSIDSSGKSKLEKQTKSWVEFFPYKVNSLNRNGQYYWKEIKNKGAFVPHDESTTLYTECKGVDSETKEKLKEYIGGIKLLNNEPKSLLETKLIPTALSKAINNGNAAHNQENVNYPYHKIVQSSFRAWGNAYLSESNENLKEKGKYSSQFELANQTSHTFSININKEIWTKHLTLKDDGSLAKLNESPDVSSLLEVYYPLSFSFYDPISGYLKKHSLFLKTELDLSYLYLNSSYSKEVFKFDIGNENREIGKDYQGFEPHLNKDKEKPYGLDGKLSLISGLELDIEKNLNIHLTARVSGFVNTKNPSCDLRHRLYKIDNTNYSSKKTLDSKWNCSEELGWKYREHIHIPSYLILSLDKEPEVSSFYINKQSGVSGATSEKKDTEQQIKTLKDLQSNLDTREITIITETDDATKADVYFKDIAAYGEHKEGKDGFPMLDLNTWFRSNQQVYYWYPRRTKGKLTNVNLENLKTIVLHLEGSKNSYNSFFHSNHFGTLTTLCLSNKSQSQSQGTKDCADDSKYDEEEKDKTPSELHKLWGSQKIDVDVDVDVNGLSSKTEENNALEVKFRVAYNRADKRDLTQKPQKDDQYKFDTIKSKLERLFKHNQQPDPSAIEIPDVSMLAVWYSVFLWKSGSDLHYATQVRPIGLVTRKIDNAYAHLTVGAAGSAGFSISKFEFKYSKKN